MKDSVDDKISHIFRQTLETVEYVRHALAERIKEDNDFSAHFRVMGFLRPAEAQAARDALMSCWSESRSDFEMRKVVAEMIGMENPLPFSSGSDDDQESEVAACTLRMFPPDGARAGWPVAAPYAYIQWQAGARQ